MRSIGCVRLDDDGLRISVTSDSHTIHHDLPVDVARAFARDIRALADEQAAERERKRAAKELGGEA